ncbi:MAG: protein translocase subunit SecD [Patescibacteria group bacterium]|nr:protein translocase subunit SecD [Patescibacteria group bacterium]
MNKSRFSILIFAIFLILSLIVVFTSLIKFKLGLDLVGGSVLMYQADLSHVQPSNIKSVLSGVKDLIERRINILGISETSVSYSQSGQVIVEIPNIKDPKEAIKIIGATPFLEFRVPASTSTAAAPTASTSAAAPTLISTSTQTSSLSLSSSSVSTSTDSAYVNFVPSKLTGKYLKSASVQIDSNTLEPYVSLVFNSQGAAIFEKLTKTYLKQPIAIYIDNTLISAPIVQDVISDGQARITGRFTLAQAKSLAQNLNEGALPVPLSLVSQSTVSPTLGKTFLDFAIKGGIIGAVLVILFMLIYYRFLGLIASIALIFYGFFNLAIYKILGVTLSLAGIAGLILSVGMAVDANILIFERTKEELKRGRKIVDAIDLGFRRAWSSIRDSNTSTLITTIIMYLMTTSFVKGFALTLGLGVLVSLLTAVFLSRNLINEFRFVLEKKQK